MFQKVSSCRCDYLFTYFEFYSRLYIATLILKRDLFFTKGGKIFQRRGRDILAARAQKAACLPVVGDRPFCCFSEAE